MGYYYEQAGQPVGPVADDQLRVHGVQGSSLVWREGMSDWAPAASVAELATYFQPPPLPPPLLTATTTPAPKLVVPHLPSGAQPTRALAGQAQYAAATPVRFSADASAHKWWHYLILAVAVIMLLLLARACGAIIGHAVTAIRQLLPAGPHLARLITNASTMG